MASDNPFSNLGLGMMGQDVAIARQAATPDSSSDKLKKILGVATAGALDAVGLKDFFDKLGESGSPTDSVPAPTGGASAPTGAVPPAYQGGINPMRLPTAVPGGVGLNAQPAGAVNPFQFQTSPAPKLTPDDEHRNQIKSAWS